MKTRIISIICVAALPFISLSCTKEKQVAESVPAPDVVIEAAIPATPLTRVAATDAENGLGWAWQEGDQIVVAGSYASVFNIRPGFSATSASFVGKQVIGDKFSIFYPGTVTSATDMEAISLADQSQEGNDSKVHLRYFAMLDGVDDYKSFTFSKEWAVGHGGSFAQSGVLRIALTLPEETSVVNRIAVKAASPLFHVGNAADALTDELVISLRDVTLGEDKTVVAWMTTSWNDDVLPAGTELTINVAAGELSWTTIYTLTAESTIKTGSVNRITIDDASVWASAGHYADGDGTEESPWIIRTAKHMMNMRGDMASGTTRYFKLDADIDMAGYDWVPLNNSGDFDMFINFDGNGHTIFNLNVPEGPDYPSFFGVLYGTVKDVTFDGANVTAGGKKAGVVAGYLGTNKNLTPCSLTGVTVKNSAISGSNALGGVVGQVAVVTTISNCHILNSTVTGGTSNNIGGFMGYPDAAGARIEDCSVTGVTVSAPNAIQYVGGFTGNINKATVFERCAVKDVVIDAATSKRVGGFVGQAGRHEGSVITSCTVENATIKGGQNSGGFVGVDYHPDISRCAVIGGTLTAGSSQAGGFAGYPEGNASIKCQITNSYSTMDVVGGSNASVGGFIGIAKGNLIVTNCYAAGAVTGTHANTGIFAGRIDVAGAAISSCIGWSSSMPFAGSIVDGAADVKDNYAGAEGTLAGKAAEMGWDPEIWDFSAKLR